MKRRKYLNTAERRTEPKPTKPAECQTADLLSSFRETHNNFPFFFVNNIISFVDLFIIFFWRRKKKKNFEI